MTLRRTPETESAGRNTPSVEAAFQAAPEELVAEILEGELHLSPRPARPHANVFYNLAGLLSGPFKFGKDGPGGWVLLAEPEPVRHRRSFMSSATGTCFGRGNHAG